MPIPIISRVFSACKCWLHEFCRGVYVVWTAKPVRGLGRLSIECEKCEHRTTAIKMIHS